MASSNSSACLAAATWPGVRTLTRILRSRSSLSQTRAPGLLDGLAPGVQAPAGERAERRDRTDLTPRERLLAAFDLPATTPLCPYIAATVELHDPQHPASQYARDYKTAIAARFTETAREAGATHPDQLGEQLVLLLDGAAARTRVLDRESFSTAAAIAAVLIDNAGCS